MTFSLVTLSVCAVAYLLLLFLIAHASERGWLPAALARHPAVYVLSLGVYATTWSYYGSVGFADRLGIGYLTIYLGVTFAFILAPVLLMPLLRLVRTHQLTSVADLFAFRFNSQLAGVLVTLMLLAGSLPYLALQIRAVAESTQVLTGGGSSGPVAIGFCAVVSVFAIIFGARHVTPRDKHTGLVVAIAFETVVKLTALVTVAVAATVLAFGSPAGLEAWLDANPERLAAFYEPVSDDLWPSLLLLSFAAAFLLPRQFHMLFTENLSPRSLLTASWAFPLLLLVLAAAIPPLLWSGIALGLDTAPDYFVLGLAVASDSTLLVLFAYLGGISAASAMIIVATLALSSMSLNHLLLPLMPPRPGRDLYTALRWARRTLIAAIIAAGYLFYLVLERSEGLVAWGLISFLAIAQFLPGIAGVLLWPRATRSGFVAGLITGGLVWGLTALLPALTTVGPIQLVGIDASLAQGIEHYASVTFWSVSTNALVFAVVSLLTRPSRRERVAAAACRDVSLQPLRGALMAHSPREFVELLSPVTGTDAAEAEVGRALTDAGLAWTESRPEHLQLLRDQVERNLSGMMGPVLAQMIVDERLRLDDDARAALAQNVRLIEERLERSRSRFRGLSAELDQLRRYHRQVLEDLPLGVVAVTPQDRVVRWNPAMAALTGLEAGEAAGRTLTDLPAPWGRLLADFIAEPTDHTHKRRLDLPGETRWLSLHKAVVARTGSNGPGDRLLLVEDVTEVQRLEEELTHSERLASIGRLAAGVAHEIGNPVTGIACLAQELEADAVDGPSRERAREVLEQTERINTIVQTLVGYAHAGSPAGERRPVRLAEATDEALRVLRLSRRARHCAFDVQVPGALYVTGDLQRLIQVFVNLFSNAVDACGEGGEIRLRTRVAGGRAHVRITDNGPGIPETIRDKILEPFFTTKSPGQGTGLGLPLVHNIIREHQGEFRIHPRRGEQSGTEVLVSLPLAADARGEAEPRYG